MAKRDLRNEPQQARSAATLRRLLDETEGLFAEVGVEAATTAEIARRAEVSIGTFYRFFADKQALIDGITDDFIADGSEGFARIIEQFPDPLAPDQYEGFVHAVVWHAADLLARRPGYLAVTWYANPSDVSSPAHKVRELQIDIIAGLFAQAGLDIGKAELRRMAFFVIETVRVLLWHAPPKGKARKVYVDEIVRMVTAYVRDRVPSLSG